MIGKLKDLTMNLNGTQNVTIEIQSDFRTTYEELKNDDIEVEIKKYSKRRSMDANNLAWGLIDQIAAKTGIKKTEVYRNAIRDIGGVSDIVCVQNVAVDKLCSGWTHKGLGWQAEKEPSKLPGCTNVVLYYGSSVFTTKQMSALIDSLIQDCESLGIPTLTQSEIDKSLAVWARKTEKKND